MSSAAGQMAWTSVATSASAEADLRSSFEHCAESLYRYFAIRSGGDTHLADDLMQQLWLAAEAFRTGRGSEPEERWLRTVAANLIRTHWRRGVRRKEAPVVDRSVARALAEQMDRGPLPDELFARHEARDQLLLALTELPGEQQELLVAHYFEGCPLATLAEQTAISVRAVEGRLYRARLALRERLLDLNGD